MTGHRNSKEMINFTERLPGATCPVAPAGQPQQVSPVWIGGQGTVPYEQNTQQSPGFGFRTAPQSLQS